MMDSRTIIVEAKNMDIVIVGVARAFAMTGMQEMIVKSVSRRI